MKMHILRTERLQITPFTAHDLELMRRLDTDADVVRYLGHGRIKSEEESATNLHKILNDYRTYGLGIFKVHEKESNQFLGRSGIIPWQLDNGLNWEIGYTFIKEAWGKGYATEMATALAKWAEHNLDVPHVISLIHPGNRASIHVAEKVGMRFSRTVQIGDLRRSLYQLDFRNK